MKTLSAGLYFVGDPCAIFNDSYNLFLNETTEEVVSTFKGMELFYGLSSWGAGKFQDGKNNSYVITSGHFGVFPAELVELDNVDTGNFINFEDDFDVDNEGGIFTFGHIIVNTDWEDLNAMTFDDPDLINEDAFWEDPMENNQYEWE